jgi:hypothetical protein
MNITGGSKQTVLIFIIITVIIALLIMLNYRNIDEPIKDEPRGFIEGILRDSSDAPLTDVAFVTKPYTPLNRTDSTGKFKLSIKEGEYQIIFNREGFDTVAAFVEIKKGANPTVKIIMNSYFQDVIIDQIDTLIQTDEISVLVKNDLEKRFFSEKIKQKKDDAENKNLITAYLVEQEKLSLNVPNVLPASFDFINNLPSSNNLHIYQSDFQMPISYNSFIHRSINSYIQGMVSQFGYGNVINIDNFSITRNSDQVVVFQSGIGNVLNQQTISDGNISNIIQLGDYNETSIKGYSDFSIISVQQYGWRNISRITQDGFMNTINIKQEN